MASREVYAPGTWEPGDPLYVRPDNVGQGGHIRRMIEAFDIGDELDGDCRCSDAASWPEPRPGADLAGSGHVIVGLPYARRVTADATDAA